MCHAVFLHISWDLVYALAGYLVKQWVGVQYFRNNASIDILGYCHIAVIITIPNYYDY